MKKLKVLHMFRWKIEDIIKMLPKVHEQGFNAILISPIQNCRDGWEWWKLYQNYGYGIGNYTGTESNLKELCSEAKNYGITIIADVLLHNVASLTGEDVHPEVDSELAKYIDESIPQCTNWEDRYQSTHFKTGLPLVPYWEKEIQKMHIEFLDKLVELGVGGFRVDMLKHFATDDEGCSYLTDVFKKYKDTGIILFGEVLNAPQHIIDMYAKDMMVCTEFIKGDKEKVVTFVESHDEYYGIKNKQYLTEDMIVSKWNELVNHSKVHSIFFVRPMEDEKGLSNLWLSPKIKEINGGN